MFSSRVPAHLPANALSRAVERARAAGRPLIDLTLTNPTRAGFAYPAGLFEALSRAESATYTPEPFGLRSAREAVAADFARRGLDLPWDRIVLTSGTSEAYSLLFKLLCDACGDTVLVPAPSYPLFEHLAGLDGVGAIPYRLQYDGRWWVDFDSVDTRWDARTRAVLAVSPNNPTGSVLTATELAGLGARCAARDAALIVDEVFADYRLGPSPTMAGDPESMMPGDVLTFRLGGLSKSAALPQVKLAWMAVEGPDDLVRGALDRLELMCDTYLSVSTPVQAAAADLIGGGAAAREQVRERIRFNDRQVRQLAAGHPAVDVLHADAGWSAVLRIPSRGTEEEMVLQLVECDNVLVHPGFFFDFACEAFLIVSLLPEPEAFGEGMRRVLERVNG